MRGDSPTILILEDDAATRTFLADNLTADGFELLVADCAAEALRLLESGEPDLALIDIGLPDGSGLAVAGRVREADGIMSRIDPGLPLIFVTGHGGELARIRGLSHGADDYVVKPFSYPELLARIRAVLRRCGHRPRRGRLRVGALEVDPMSHEVILHGRHIDVSGKEFALLRALAAEPTRVFTKEELLRDVWGYRALGSTRTLDSHACRLRRKLSVHGDSFVVNVWGVGYRLADSLVAP